MIDESETGFTARLPGWFRRLGGNPQMPEQPVVLPPKGLQGSTFSLSEQRQLLSLARWALRDAVSFQTLPKPDTTNFPAKFLEPAGCFVTLTNHGDLRGCIGQVVPRDPLYLGVMRNAQTAALNDLRFESVQALELESIEIEVSVLSALAPLKFSSPDELLQKLRPGQDGVVLKVQGRSATFLPQVWEHYPDKEEFLSRLSQKAGCGPLAWRKPGASVQIYAVQAFGESE